MLDQREVLLITITFHFAMLAIVAVFLLNDKKYNHMIFLKNPFLLVKFVGTDAYLMHSFLPYMGWKWKLKVRIKRLWYRFLDKFIIQEYIVDHENLGEHLKKAGFKKPFRVFKDPVWNPQPFDKKEHTGFNILYYDPTDRMNNKESMRWRHGLELIDKAMDFFDSDFNISWIKVDGTADMSWIWPIVDFYARPCRVDGASRMRQEAELNGIPYYWTYENPCFTDLIEAINKIAKNKTNNKNN